MPRQMRRRGRPRTQWAIRAGLGLIATAGGYIAVTRSVAQALAPAQPALAFRLAPGDPWVQARFAESLAGADASDADRARADALSRDALRRDPTAIAAVTTLGIDAQVRGDVAGARRAFAFAEQLSRRNLPTHLWKIEEAVARGDVDDALRHYDMALRTSPGVADLLFPVLTSASSDPALRNGLVRTLAARPAWGEAFVNHAAISNDDPASVAALLLALRRAGLATSERADAGVLSGLLGKSQFAAAWSYFARVRAGVTADRSRDPRFTGPSDAPSAFDWTVIGDTGVSASIQRGSQGGILQYSAPPSVGGTILRQFQVLPIGSYRLFGHADGIDQPEESRPYWLMTCGDGREIGRVSVSASAASNGAFGGSFDVPGGCPLQTLQFVVQPSDAASGSAGEIDFVEVRPSRSSERAR